MHQKLKIVLTGPESTGKTALAEALAEHLGVACVREFARYFVAHLGRPYDRADLRAIGRGQQAWEDWHAAQNPPLLVCDTDWTVLHIWEQYRFGAPAEGRWTWEAGYANARRADLYLLCAPDFPWQPDPLREHPEERAVLFDWYERLLQTTGAAYMVVTGAHEQRLQTALAQIQKLC
jgi:nicotinamide riboside kinase